MCSINCLLPDLTVRYKNRCWNQTSGCIQPLISHIAINYKTYIDSSRRVVSSVCWTERLSPLGTLPAPWPSLPETHIFSLPQCQVNECRAISLELRNERILSFIFNLTNINCFTESRLAQCLCWIKLRPGSYVPSWPFEIEFTTSTVDITSEYLRWLVSFQLTGWCAARWLRWELSLNWIPSLM